MRSPLRVLAALATLALAEAAATNPSARADIVLGAAAPYGVIAETGVAHVNVNNATVTANFAIADPTGQLANTSNGFVFGNADFAGPANVQTSSSFHGTATGNVDLTAPLNAITTLSTTSDTNASGSPVVNLMNGTVIDITTGKLVGNTYYFTVGTTSLGGGAVVTINGANSGDNVVFNVPAANNGINFQNSTIAITGGLNPDSVLFNVPGTNHTLQSAAATINAILLDPNGTISIDNTTVNGRVYGGDNNDMNLNSGTVIRQAGVPEPSALASACFVVVIGLGYSWHRRRRAA
jgi:hypothetical protein